MTSDRLQDVCGRIISVQGPPPDANGNIVGPASSITYTIAIYVGDGGLVAVPNQKPGIQRYAMVEAVRVGTPVRGWIEVGRFYYWDFRELLAGVDCAGNPVSLADQSPFPAMPPPQNPPPPQMGPSVSAGGASQVSPPGGSS